ncbi:hypothetical protein AAVH_06753 [Aphelenchoides avenae]|nr:hypothetical protein AAVH_06753 [Aphelenchus avenae]
MVDVDTPASDNTEEPITARERSQVASKLVLRPRSTVKFKTSSGRVLTVRDQPALLTFGDFRKLFRTPSDTAKLFVFKSRGEQGTPDEWIVAVDDAMKLPLIDGVIGVGVIWTDL